MIVDLMRNDIGRVAVAGSVKYQSCSWWNPSLPCIIWSALNGATTRTVTRQRSAARSFSCGSITGAPKVRAMEIIDELERSDVMPGAAALAI